MKEGLIIIDKDIRKAFINAWEEAFKRVLSSEFYAWIFNNTNILYAYVIENKVAAGYCLLPVTIMHDKQETKALLCNNVFVSPKFQGKHLFVKLSKLALDDAYKRLGYKVAYGIPNPQALPGHKRVGWNVSKQIDFLSKKRSLAVLNDKEVWFGKVLNERQIKDIELCSYESALNKHLSLIKTIDFIKWRYLNKPDTDYNFCLVYEKNKLKAYSVFKVYEEGCVLDIIDFDATDEASAIKLLKAIDLAPLDFENMHVWGSNRFRDCFIKSGYSVSESKSNLIYADLSDIKNSKNIDLTMNLVLADNDVF